MVVFGGSINSNLSLGLTPFNAQSVTQQPGSENVTTAVHSSDLLVCSWAGPNPGEIAAIGPLFVQNGRLISINNFQNITQLTTPYPFSRLAWTNGSTPASLYIYHQINNATLVEDGYHVGSGWNTANINV
jgi:hypothetical protein